MHFLEADQESIEDWIQYCCRTDFENFKSNLTCNKC